MCINPSAIIHNTNLNKSFVLDNRIHYPHKTNNKATALLIFSLKHYYETRLIPQTENYIQTRLFLITFEDIEAF
jgi:hypothetical protein